MKNLFSNIALSFEAKCKERKSLPTCQSFRRKTVYFTEQSVLLKKPIRIDYLIKELKRNHEAGLQGNWSA